MQITKEEKRMIISTFCQDCDIDLSDIEGDYQQESNVMSYTCTKCGSDQEQQNWEEK
jgi:Zn ribbon nucleic-acid-binding protein